ncbi:hypothetical protein K0M31_008181 [Melipona bicolor]|uniref:NADH dehydrogenase [ubiquinone] 1 alpha subcomplex subunit 10, mitochondrial n=1 Tax=Melipona bicolor TaxID=60889 RepID=A0AA40KKC0_9HYME|nr:hypothetical protein K0M31_008181 [Melipona bicolor]
MTSILSTTIAKSNSFGYLTRLCKASKNVNNLMQVAFMRTLKFKIETPKPDPYPYWNKSCLKPSKIIDLTYLTYDENTKLIVVDGPPAVGKSKFCEDLAKEFGLLYMPSPMFDEMYINCYGYDVRNINPDLPEAWQFRDLTNFLKDPNHTGTPRIQLGYFLMRYEQCMNAIIHILSTGQGVVLNRSIFTDFGFIYAMHNSGYIQENTLKIFEQLRNEATKQLLMPHLVIYLEATPETTLERIRKRANSDEINSKIFTKKYLSDLDNGVKEKCFSWLTEHSEILVYDWNKGGNVKDVTDDIENLDLEESEAKTKFSNWIFRDGHHLNDVLYSYQMKWDLFANIDDIIIDKYVKELLLPSEAEETIQDILDKVDTEKYQYEYNPKYKKVPWFTKDKDMVFSLYRRTPRDFVNCDLFKLPYQTDNL